MKRMIQLTLMLLLSAAFFTPNATSQGMPGGHPRPFDHDQPGGPGSQFEKFRMNKMNEMLELNEAQQKTMKELFEKHIEQVRKLDEESRVLLDQLIPLVKSKSTDEVSIAKILVKLDSLDARRDQMRTEFKAEADKSLTIIQRAKLRVFEQRFERQMIKKVRGMHDRRGGPGGPMTPPPMDDDSEG